MDKSRERGKGVEKMGENRVRDGRESREGKGSGEDGRIE